MCSHRLLIIWLVALLLGLPSSLTGQSPGRNNPWTAGEDLSGRSVTIYGAFDGNSAALFMASMRPFETATGITINYVESPNYEERLLRLLANEQEPDIVLFPNLGMVRRMADRDAIVDLSDWLSRTYLEGQYGDALLEQLEYDGMTAGIWYRVSPKSLVWYPRDEFRRAGYEVPRSWGELLDLSRRMAAEGRDPWSIALGSAAATGWVVTDWVEDLMLRIHPAEVYDAWVDGALRFDSPEVRLALNYLARIWKDPELVYGEPRDIIDIPFGDGPDPLLADPPLAWLHKQAAFIPTFMPPDTRIGSDVDFFYFPPVPEDEGGVGGRPVLGSGDIAAAMEDRPEVAAVMRWLSTGSSTRAWASSGGLVSPHLDSALEWYPDEFHRQQARLIREATVFRVDASDIMPEQVGTGAFWQQMVEWVRGMPTSELLPVIDAAWPEEQRPDYSFGGSVVRRSLPPMEPSDLILREYPVVLGNHAVIRVMGNEGGGRWNPSTLAVVDLESGESVGWFSKAELEEQVEGFSHLGELGSVGGKLLLAVDPVRLVEFEELLSEGPARLIEVPGELHEGLAVGFRSRDPYVGDLVIVDLASMEETSGFVEPTEQRGGPRDSDHIEVIRAGEGIVVTRKASGGSRTIVRLFDYSGKELLTTTVAPVLYDAFPGEVIHLVGRIPGRSRQTSVFALDRAGNRLWTSHEESSGPGEFLEGRIERTYYPVSGGELLLELEEGRVTILDGATGREVRNFSVDEHRSSVVAYPYFLTMQKERLTAYDLTDGRLTWSRSVGDGRPSSFDWSNHRDETSISRHSLHPERGTIVVAADGYLTEVDIGTGELVGRIRVEDPSPAVEW